MGFEHLLAQISSLNLVAELTLLDKDKREIFLIIGRPRKGKWNLLPMKEESRGVWCNSRVTVQ